MLNSSRQNKDWRWPRAEEGLRRGDVGSRECRSTRKALGMSDDETEQAVGVCNTIEIYTLK